MLGSAQGPSELVTDDDIAQLRKAAEASRKKKTTSTTEEEEEKEEVERMDEADMLVTERTKMRLVDQVLVMDRD